MNCHRVLRDFEELKRNKKKKTHEKSNVLEINRYSRLRRRLISDDNSKRSFKK